ncbi:MAG: D-alanyl-D-alanine carboxypeptidase [Alphaproteobacteria bacterium]|nr:D-alanyl-D-alanine carboxypeptidase [Alphaproteobacteria bacterium]
MRNKYTVIIFTIILSLICNVYDCYAAKIKNKTKKKNTKSELIISVPKQSIVMDFDTGEVVSELNAHELCTPSSMTKIMTLYLVFEALVEGKLHLDEELPVSENAKNQEGSRSFFEAGSLVSVKNLILSMIVHSGNDACVVIAEKLAGDEEAFAALMNEKAEQFGLKNTHFTNSTGLPNEKHYSTMYDLAIISRHIIADFPEYYRYFAEKTFTANGITQNNRNTLLGNSLNIDGLKTGHTKAGGFGIVISGKKNGKRLIAIVNGCKSEKARAIEANKILALGFNEYINVKVASKDYPVTTANVQFGKRDKVNLYTNENISAVIPKKYRKSLVISVNVNEPIPAPILHGTKVGTLTYKYGNYSSKEFELFVHEPVAKMNTVERFSYNIKAWFNKNTTTPGLSSEKNEIHTTTDAEENIN